MRLNRGTIVLLLASLVVIIAVLILSNNQASAPDTATPVAATAETTGPLFPGLEYASARTLEIVNNGTGEKTVLTKRQTGDWLISDATYATDREVDQPTTTAFMQRFVDLQINDSFTPTNLADFGLATPAYVVTLTTDEGTVHHIYIGNKNPTGNRYYVLLDTVEGAAPVSESTADATSEVTAESTIEATAETLADATTEAIVEATAEATPEATAEVGVDATVEVESTTESVSEGTPEPYASVTLSELTTVYVVSLNSMDEVIALITAPPYVPAPTPTSTPTATLNPLSEVDLATMTAEVNTAMTAIFEQFAATATAEAAQLEATAEATAEQ